MERLTITAPEPLRVFQRTSLAPGLGRGTVTVRGLGAPESAARARVRTIATAEAFGEESGWVDAPLKREPDGSFELSAEVPAGGWFHLDVRLLAGDGTAVATGEVVPVGVGEVFVVAGQSYAAVCHERVLVVEDPMGRVVATSPEQPGWRYAHDPQPRIVTRIDGDALAEIAEVLDQLDLSFPHGDRSPFLGTIWPAFGNNLLLLERVPVALVHAAVGATRVGMWHPGSQLFANVVDAVEMAGDYRAVLWQQGESDVAYGTTTEEYAAALRAMRSALVSRTGLDRPWLPAKSTHHPLGPAEPGDEAPVRAAVDLLWGEEGFAPGPDTDTLQGPDHRAGWFRGAHLTALGQQRAGLLWAGAVHALLRRPAPSNFEDHHA